METVRGKRRKFAGALGNGTLGHGSTGHQGKRALYHCNYCQKDISSCPRIKCAICPDFDLCLECFAVGCEITPHRRDHDYRVVDNLSFPIYHPEWGDAPFTSDLALLPLVHADEELQMLELRERHEHMKHTGLSEALHCCCWLQADADLVEADEEILLLEAIDIYGPGNWGAVAEHVGNKSAAACKAHYHEIYIHVETYPLPKPSPAMQYFDPSVLPKQQQEQQRKMVEDTQAAGAAVAQARKKENSWAELNRQEEAQIAASMPSISAQRPSKKSRTSSAQASAATPTQPPTDPAAQGPAHLKQEVKEEKPCPSNLQNVKVEQKERDAEEEGAATASAAAHVVMDVDSMHLEGEHLTQAQASKDFLKGQKAAAQGMKHVAHAKAASKKEPKTEDQTHQTAATGRTLHGDNAAPAAPPPKANPEGTQGPPEQTAQQGGDAGAAELPTGGAAPATNTVTAASGQDPKASGFDVTGYHAKRREFDPEYDNDAECVIADMEFTDADTEEDRQLKLRMLEIYNKRLDEREARHDFLAEHGLLNMRKVQALDRRRTGPERDTHAKLRVFARYSAPAEHDNLVEGLLLEQRLRSRIEELKENRRQGARTIADAEAMESDRKQKAKGQAQPSTQRAAGSSWSSLAPLGVTPLPGPTPFPIAPSPYFPAATPQRNFHDNLAAAGTVPLPLLSPLPPTAAAAQPGTAGPAAPGAAPLAAPGAAQPLGNAASAAATPQGQGLEASAAHSLGLPAAGAGLQGMLAGAPAAAAAHTAEGGGVGAQGAARLSSGVHAAAQGGSSGWGGGVRGGRELGPPPSATAPPPGGNKGAGAALASWRTRRGVALDISCMPGVELLGGRERELCATSRLHPAHYLALKDMMLRDCARHGTISRQEARTFFRLDASRSLRLYDLWVQLGWVSAPATQKKAASGGAGEAGTAASAAARAASEDGDFEETI